MKGLIHWFKSSSKMKRWMLLILFGIILTCFGIAQILVKDEMSFSRVTKIIIIFAVGFVAIVLGLIFLNKRSMEMVIESTDERMKDRKNINVNSLIFNKTVYDQGPNIVAIGGGTGLDTVLTGLKNYTNNITAIVPISDYGEASSQSRKELETLPLNEIKESIIALSSNEEEMKKLLEYKFTKGKLKGLEFSDIYFSAMQSANGGNFTKSIIESSNVLNMNGKVLPATLDEVKVVAELENGYIVEEKAKIPEMVTEKFTQISRVRLTPSNCKATPEAVEAILNADCIILGPGSLYTNVIPCLLVNGITKAIMDSKAIKIYVSNIMTEPGQTDEYTVADHVNAILEHCQQNIIDYCIYDTGEIIPEFIKKYNMEGQELVLQTSEKSKGVKFIQKDLSTVNGEFIRHDPEAIAQAVIELVCDDLKYQDKENDPQYMMLNNKLREEKRINKEKEKSKKAKRQGKEKNKEQDIPRGKSKFSSKYQDRIKSIREADAKAKLKKQNETAKTERKMQKDIEKQKKVTTKTTTKTTTSRKAPQRETVKKEEPVLRKSARGLKKGKRAKENK